MFVHYFQKGWSFTKEIWFRPKDSNDGFLPGTSIQEAKPLMPRGFLFNDISTSMNDTGNKKRKQYYFPFYHWCYWISLGTKFSDDKKTPTGSGLMPCLTLPGTKKPLWAVCFCTYPSLSSNREQCGNLWFSSTHRKYFNLKNWQFCLEWHL